MDEALMTKEGLNLKFEWHATRRCPLTPALSPGKGEGEPSAGSVVSLGFGFRSSFVIRTSSLVISLALCSLGCGAEPKAAPVPPGPGLINEWLREQSPA